MTLEEKKSNQKSEYINTWINYQGLLRMQNQQQRIFDPSENSLKKIPMKMRAIPPRNNSIPVQKDSQQEGPSQNRSRK